MAFSGKQDDVIPMNRIFETKLSEFTLYVVATGLSSYLPIPSSIPIYFF